VQDTPDVGCVEVFGGMVVWRKDADYQALSLAYEHLRGTLLQYVFFSRMKAGRRLWMVWILVRGVGNRWLCGMVFVSMRESMFYERNGT